MALIPGSHYSGPSKKKVKTWPDFALAPKWQPLSDLHHRGCTCKTGSTCRGWSGLGVFAELFDMGQVG